MEPVANYYRLPTLLALFPQDLTDGQRGNPLFYELDTDFTRWLKSLKLDARIEETLKKIQMPVLICFAYPRASLDQLRTCLDYLTLAFIFEEITDATSSVHSQRWADIYMDMYRGTCSIPPDSYEAQHPLFPVMLSLANGIMASIGLTYRDRFIHENLLSAQAIVQEAVDRETSTTELNKHSKTLEAYYDNRHATVGMMPFVILAQWVHDMSLPSDPSSSVCINEMSKATVEMVFLANDIYSFKKEKLANDAQNNVITVIMNDESTGIHPNDIQGSFDYSYNLFKQALARLYDNDKILLSDSSISATHQPAVGQYRQALIDCIVGNIKWSMVCRRYAVFENEQRRTVSEVVII